MSDAHEQLRRVRAEESLRAEFDLSLRQRAERCLEVRRQGILPNHHFASASSECLKLYRDGYFLSTVMVSQSVAEGIFRFILERNSLTSEEGLKIPEMAKLLVRKGLISSECANAFARIWCSFRNDVHHMNPKVVEVPFTKLAQRNISDLASIENEVFAYRTNQGKLLPVQAKYWDLNEDGSVPVFLRLE